MNLLVLMKIIIIVFLITILYTLASSLFYLVREKGEGTGTVNRLSWRIGLSIVLFLLLWVAYQLGWIEPTSGPVRVKAPETSEVE